MTTVYLATYVNYCMHCMLIFLVLDFGWAGLNIMRPLWCNDQRYIHVNITKRKKNPCEDETTGCKFRALKKQQLKAWQKNNGKKAKLVAFHSPQLWHLASLCLSGLLGAVRRVHTRVRAQGGEDDVHLWVQASIFWSAQRGTLLGAWRRRRKKKSIRENEREWQQPGGSGEGITGPPTYSWKRNYCCLL